MRRGFALDSLHILAIAVFLFIAGLLSHTMWDFIYTNAPDSLQSASSPVDDGIQNAFKIYMYLLLFVVLLSYISSLQRLSMIEFNLLSSIYAFLHSALYTFFAYIYVYIGKTFSSVEYLSDTADKHQLVTSFVTGQGIVLLWLVFFFIAIVFMLSGSRGDRYERL